MNGSLDEEWVNNRGTLGDYAWSLINGSVAQ